MKERPILFSGPMVRAILDGRKNQTRRVINPQPAMPWRAWDGTTHYWQDGDELMRCPYGKAGDRLWVRETWNCIDTGRLTQRQDWVRYRATDGEEMRWRPSIFMPRWASRITLEVVNIKAERLHRIGELSAKAEGVEPKAAMSVARGGESYLSYCEAFSELWDQINAKRGYGWNANPWVWVVEFKAVQP